MDGDSRQRGRLRMRSKIVSNLPYYRDAPYRKDFRRSRSDDASNNCKRLGHFASDCPNVSVCNNCGLPGHIAVECTLKPFCWNCREPGHVTSECSNDLICRTCGKSGHFSRNCRAPELPPGDIRLCNNCHKPGHTTVECTNEKAKLDILLATAPTGQFETCAIYLVMLLGNARSGEFWMIIGVEDLWMKGVEDLMT